jgi:hypothetical protein
VPFTEVAYAQESTSANVGHWHWTQRHEAIACRLSVDVRCGPIQQLAKQKVVVMPSAEICIL